MISEGVNMAKKPQQEHFDDMGKEGPLATQAKKVIDMRIESVEHSENLKAEENAMLDMLETEGKVKFVYGDHIFTTQNIPGKRKLVVKSKD